MSALNSDEPALPKNRSRALRVLLWSLVGVVCVLLVVRALLTTVIVRTVIAQAPAYIHGRIEVDDLALELRRGGASLQGVRLYVDGDPDASPAVSFDSLSVRVSLSGLLAGRVDFGEVHLVEPELRLDRDENGELVLLGLMREVETQETVEEPDAGEADAPLRMRFDGVRIDDGRLRYAGLDFTLDLEASGWNLAGDREGHVKLDLRSGEKSIALDLSAVIAEQRGRVDLSWSDVDLHGMAVALAAEFGKVVRRASSDGELELILDQGEGDGRILRGQGRIAFTGVAAKLKAPEDVDAIWKHLEVPIKAIEVELVPDAEGTLGPQSPIVVRLGQIALNSPHVTYIRDPNTARADAASEQADDALEVDLTIEKITLDDGLLRFVDRTVKPTVDIPLSSLRAEVAGLALTPLVIESFIVKAHMLGDAPVSVVGAVSPDKTTIQASGSQIYMLPLDGYLRDVAEIQVDAGSVTVESDVEIGQQRYQAPTKVVFKDISLSGGGDGTIFMDAFGMPVGVAVALLRDYKGEIALDLPIQGANTGGGVAWSSVFTNAMRGTLTAALASPINALGAMSDVVLGSGSLLETDLVFTPGKAELLPTARARLDAIATLLESRPNFEVEIEGFVCQADLSDLAAGEEAFGDVERASKGLAGSRAKAVFEYLSERVNGLGDRSEIQGSSGELTDQGSVAQILVKPAGRF